MRTGNCAAIASTEDHRPTTVGKQFLAQIGGEGTFAASADYDIADTDDGECGLVGRKDSVVEAMVPNGGNKTEGASQGPQESFRESAVSDQ